MQPHRGVLILVLGILSIVMCGLFTGIPAWIMGNGDMAKIRNKEMDPSGETLTNLGRILGIIGTLLSVVSIIAVPVFFLLGLAFFSVAAPK